jgi:hypothetical protein
MHASRLDILVPSVKLMFRLVNNEYKKITLLRKVITQRKGRIANVQKFLKITINRFNPASYLCLAQTRTRISKVICHGHFWIEWVNVKSLLVLLTLVELLTITVLNFLFKSILDCLQIM